MLWFARSQPATPMLAKIRCMLAVAYALSPIDLIPDFIPVLGYLDDLIIVPLGILLAVRLIPDPLMAEFRARATERDRPGSRAGLVAIIVIWLLAAAILAWLLWPELLG